MEWAPSRLNKGTDNYVIHLSSCAVSFHRVLGFWTVAIAPVHRVTLQMLGPCPPHVRFSSSWRLLEGRFVSEAVRSAPPPPTSLDEFQRNLALKACKVASLILVLTVQLKCPVNLKTKLKSEQFANKSRTFGLGAPI
jgi:hypothetical protein